MADHTNDEKLTQRVTDAIAQGRVEVHRLRKQLSLARVMHRVVNQHTGRGTSSHSSRGVIPQ